MRVLPDGFDTVDELYTLDELGQLVMPVEAAPALLGRLGEFEDHGERRLVGEAALRAHGSMPHGGKAAFDGVGGAQVLPVLGREVVEGQQCRAILGQAIDRLVVFDGLGPDEGIEGGFGVVPGLGHPDLLSARAWPWVAGCSAVC